MKPHQFGFRSGHSTTHQILRLIEYITEGFNLKQYSGAVFLDATAAFDTVWTTGLLYKMANLTIPPAMIRLIKSHLQNRSFFVTVNGKHSPCRRVANGTPQGSILGPVLFNIYVNDIPKVGRALIAQYADDTATYFRARDLPTLQAELQRSLDAITHYFHRWRIKINAQKTEAALFTYRKTGPAGLHRLRIGAQQRDWKNQANKETTPGQGGRN